MAGMIVHEWLASTGGSENVVEILASTFPDAPITCLWNDSNERFAPGRVSETWLARTPLRRSKAFALPLMPPTWRHLPTAQADWILCSSHLFAHHARFAGPARSAPKFVYTHTPARYIWTPELDGRGRSAIARTLAAPLKFVDRKRAAEAHQIAANSQFIQDRIERAWRRDSTVIYPPVNVGAYVASSQGALSFGDELILDGLPEIFILGASRYVPYKRLDVVIATGVACGVPVVLAGEGPEETHLRALADEHPGSVTFIPRPSFALLNELFRRALVYVFPPVEDFGIMPVEAMATGTPVIANAVGGASESVVHGVTGALVGSFARSELRSAVDIAVASRAEDCVSRAWDFDVSVFQREIQDWVLRG